MASNPMRTSTLLLAFLLALTAVSADEALIRKTCEGEDRPDLCEKCMNADPRGKQEDSTGLASIGITCTWDQADVVQKLFEGVAASNPDPTLRDFSKKCVSILSTITVPSLKQAFDLWTAHDYDGATRNITHARFVVYNDCIFGFPGRSFKDLPADLVTAVNDYLDYCDISRDLLVDLQTSG